ncbi:MAG: two-component regulator propeller domain-containing protein [Candidatus Helarchaeota archaeon]
MTLIRNYNFSENQITAFAVDSAGYLWIAFAQDANGNCAFQKVSANNPLQKYYDIDISVDEIKKISVSGSYVYLAYDDATYIGTKYSLLNPLTTYTNFSLPAGITEAPIDVLINGSDLFYLIPGESSGLNAKVVKMSTAGVFDQTIDLATVTNAKSITIDSGSGDLWVCTNTDPSTYVRVYQQSGGNWTYIVNN